MLFLILSYEKYEFEHEYLGQSPTQYGSRSVIWSVIRICYRDNFGHDRLKMGIKKPFFTADNFSGEQIKKNLHYDSDS